MNTYDEEFLKEFNKFYPFERYIIETPKSIDNLFDDLLLTEIFIPKTEINPILDHNGELITFSKMNTDDIYIKAKSNAGEIRLGYFDFEEHIRENIRNIFYEDFGMYAYECLFVDYEDLSQLKSKLNLQKELIISKYGECNIKLFTLRSTLIT